MRIVENEVEVMPVGVVVVLLGEFGVDNFEGVLDNVGVISSLFISLICLCSF